MFCPKCRYEYKAGVHKCPDCGIPLVTVLPPKDKDKPESEYVELVTVMTTGNLAELAVAKSILEAVGIKYFAKTETLRQLFAAGLVELQVGRGDEDEARELLENMEESGSGFPDEENPDNGDR
ncbi:MAG: DUF2007 domain-containing protein [candidate division Zixibacteria bacterium]|nr:DUF2007 domain-containing protein [candidate division Zixibacteria bacterium]